MKVRFFFFAHNSKQWRIFSKTTPNFEKKIVGVGRYYRVSELLIELNITNKI